jgi:hypothetical protein
VFANAPRVQQPFAVFRGFPYTSLDDGMYNSTSLHAGVPLQSFVRETNLDGSRVTARVGIDKVSCCMHVINVLPGAQVLYLGDSWRGYTNYSEFEVLFAPNMGKFHRIENYGKSLEGAPSQPQPYTHTDPLTNVQVHTYVYEPNSDAGGTHLTSRSALAAWTRGGRGPLKTSIVSFGSFRARYKQTRSHANEHTIFRKYAKYAKAIQALRERE